LLHGRFTNRRHRHIVFITEDVGHRLSSGPSTTGHRASPTRASRQRRTEQRALCAGSTNRQTPHRANDKFFELHADVGVLSGTFGRTGDLRRLGGHEYLIVSNGDPDGSGHRHAVISSSSNFIGNSGTTPGTQHALRRLRRQWRTTDHPTNQVFS